MGPPCFGMFPLCKRRRGRVMHRGPMLSDRDCAKRQAGMGMRHQPQSATAGCGTGASRAIPVRGAISEMGVRRQWSPQKRPSYETGVGRFVSRSPNFQMHTNIGGHARNRVVFINRRYLKGVVRPSLEKRQAALEHKARSAKSEFRAPPFRPAAPSRVDENHPVSGRSPP